MVVTGGSAPYFASFRLSCVVLGCALVFLTTAGADGADETRELCDSVEPLDLPNSPRLYLLTVQL